jgi:hypothetical protein
LEDHPALKSWRLQLLRTYLGRHSEIFEYVSPNRLRHVIVKRINDSITPEAADAAITREFEALQAVRRNLPSQLLETIPQPLMILPDSKALVVEALAGKPLNLILKREANRFIGPLRVRRMVALGQLSGDWLRQFHQRTASTPLPHDSPKFLAYVDRRLARCRALGVTNETIDVLSGMIGRASREMDGYPGPAAARQGDFIPQNILVDGDRPGVVDFESFDEHDSIYEDLATFISYVQALTAFPYYSRRALGSLVEGFLQAYGLKDDEPLFRLYLARSIVVLISETNMGRGALNGQKRLRLLQAQLHRVCEGLPRSISIAA